MNGLELKGTHDIVRHPEYVAVLDDFRSPSGEQMVLMHIDFTDKFVPSSLKRLLIEWSAFRSVTDAPLYGIEPNPDDSKWERFVSLLGFQNTFSRVTCTDGQTRRLFVSLPPQKELTNGQQQHADAEVYERAVAGSGELPH